MKVQKIQNTPNFGFNQNLNNAVIDKLTTAKHNRPFFDTLLKLNQLTNETETLIRKAETSRNKALTAKLEDAFVIMKSYFASCMDYFFPKINYSSREAVAYAQEITEKQIKDPEYWGYNIMNILSENTKLQEEGETYTGSLIQDKDGNLFLCDEEGNTIKQMTMEELPDEIQEYINELNSQGSAAGKIAQSEDEDDEEKKDVKKLIQVFQPTELDKTGFAGLVGMNELKKTLKKDVVEALKDPQQTRIDEKEYGIDIMPKGILLYGPPGCGKTTVAKRLAVEAGLPLFMMKVGNFGTALYHGTSNNISNIFNYAKSQATPEKPVLMFFDDADAIFMARNMHTDQFQQEEITTFLDAIDDGAANNVISIATTNRFDIMDEAIRRRFEFHAEVPLPDFEMRKSLIKTALNSERGKVLASDENAIESLAKRFDGYSVDTILKTARKALKSALRDENGRRDVNEADFIKIMETPEFVNQKVNQNLYKTNNSRKSVGFTR